MSDEKSEKSRYVEIVLTKDDTKVLVDNLLNPPEIAGPLKEAAEKWIRRQADLEDEAIKVGGVTAGSMDTPLKAVLFGLEGTLVEARELHRLSFEEALAEHGYSIPIAECTFKYQGLPNKAKLDMLTAEKGLPINLRDWILRRTQVFTRRRIEKDIRLDEQKVGLFKSLRARGVKIAVCSNAPTQLAMMLLDKVGVLPFTDLYLTCDDVENAKPSPEIFLKAAKYLEIDITECVIVEDCPRGIEAAFAAGPALVVEVDGPNDVTEALF